LPLSLEGLVLCISYLTKPCGYLSDAPVLDHITPSQLNHAADLWYKESTTL